MNTKTKSQLERIREYLKSGASITPLEALEYFGCFRLSAIIYTLKNDYGLKFKTEFIKNKYGNKFAKYTLINEHNDTI